MARSMPWFSLREFDNFLNSSDSAIRYGNDTYKILVASCGPLFDTTVLNANDAFCKYNTKVLTVDFYILQFHKPVSKNRGEWKISVVNLRL